MKLLIYGAGVIGSLYAVLLKNGEMIHRGGSFATHICTLARMFGRYNGK